VTTDSEHDAGADLQAQGVSPRLDGGEPTGDAAPVSLDHGSGAEADLLHVIPDWSWLPAVRGYLGRIGATARGMFSAVVKEYQAGYPADVAAIRVDKDSGKVQVTSHTGADVSAYEPTEAESHAIAIEVKAAHWPENITPHSARDLPDAIKLADPEHLFEFRTAPTKGAPKGDIIMLQLRRQPDGKRRAYVPYTYWSDGLWRPREPDGLLPLWGLDQLDKHSRVFLHEGAKAARAVRRLVEAWNPEGKAALAAHPWGDSLKNAAHLGWIGGALSPHRTDWSPLARAGVTDVYIVADNDRAGLQAVPKIARALGAYSITVWMVRFDKNFPEGFDLADPFPPKMFKAVGGGLRYTGPPFVECVSAATWATSAVPAPRTGGRGAPRRPTYNLRQECAAQYVVVNSGTKPTFHPAHDPTRRYDDAGFNMLMGPFSDYPRPAELFRGQAAFASAVEGVTYAPNTPARIINVAGRLNLNLFTPPSVRAQPGNAEPWLDFLKYLIPSADERGEVERWLATLIAHPGVRMKWGLLLASTMQGVGKTTLCEILRKLVGERNTSNPAAHQVVNSQFNPWIAAKRLVFVNEIYAERSWAAYNNLKSAVTDPSVEVNEKFLPPYTLPNWAHFILCSNSTLALPMEEHDRRWFAPEVTEELRPPDHWRDFYAWLEGGGYGIIRWWAEHHKGQVGPGEVAPQSRRKDQMIADSRSAEEVMVRDLAAAALTLAADKKDADGNVIAAGTPVVIVEADVTAWLKEALGPGAQTRGRIVRGWLTGGGLHVSKYRVKVNGALRHVATTAPLTNEGWIDLKPYHRAPHDLMESDL
jgi:hypothetical protein